MKQLIPILALAVLSACKPQDPAPLPPQVGTKAPPPAAAPAAPPVSTTADAPPADATTPVTTDGAAPANATAATTDAASTAPAPAAIDGAAIYQQTCATCHATGLAGAPKPGDTADWAPRIAQGEAVLLQHALAGYTGKKGVMPPKGGFMHLSEEQIRAVIAHMTATP